MSLPALMGRHRRRYHYIFNDGSNWEMPNRPDELTPSERARIDWERRYKTPYSIMVGQRLRRLRTSQGLTQSQVLQNVPKPGIRKTYSQGLLSRIEKGYASSPLYTYVHLAEAFELDPGRLLGSDEAQKPISEAEMTLIRFLRRAGVSPDAAIARVAKGV